MASVKVVNQLATMELFKREPDLTDVAFLDEIWWPEAKGGMIELTTQETVEKSFDLMYSQITTAIESKSESNAVFMVGVKIMPEGNSGTYSLYFVKSKKSLYAVKETDTKFVYSKIVIKVTPIENSD